MNEILMATGASHDLDLLPCTLKDLPREERPRERLLARGPEQLTDGELLGILLGSGVPGATAVEVGRRLVARCGGLAGLGRRTAVDLAAQKGVGAARAARVAAGVELGRRLAAAPLGPGALLSGPEAVARHFGPLLRDAVRERFYAVLLDRRNRVIGERLIAEGTLGAAYLHPREVFEPAIREHASAVIAVHNHPSGDPTPSEADLAMTRRLSLCARILGIPLLDHLVVAGDAFVSLDEAGALATRCPEIEALDDVAEPRIRWRRDPGRRPASRPGPSP